MSNTYLIRGALAPEAEVDLTGGRLTLAVRRGGTTVLRPSALGVETAHADFTQKLRFAGFSQRRVQETYSTTFGDESSGVCLVDRGDYPHACE